MFKERTPGKGGRENEERLPDVSSMETEVERES